MENHSTINHNGENEDDKIKINPYNINNKLISEEEVLEILKKGDLENIQINNLELYRKSFCHKSYCKKKKNNDVEIAEKTVDAIELREESNERLEFLGDSIISSVVAKYLFERFPDQDEGFMTRIRTKLVNGQTLANFAVIIGLSEFLIISRHVEERCNGRNNFRILEDVFESFIGALFLDFNDISLEKYFEKKNSILEIENNLKKILEVKLSNKNKKIITDCLDELNNLHFNDFESSFSGPGYQICQIFIINIIEGNMSFQDLILKDDNYKDRLLRYFQSNYQTTPKYREEEIEGPAHSRIFTMSVLGPNRNTIGTGKGKTKKKAEQKASQFALIYLGILPSEMLLENEDDSNED